MYGAIIGDIVGSRFEFRNYKAKDFEFYHQKCHFTDDSAMTIAIARAIMECYGDYDNILHYTAKSCMRQIGNKYPHSGFGGQFAKWLRNPRMGAYKSYGNGAAMRVSAAGWAGKDLNEVEKLAIKVTEVTHNHPESIRAAKAVASAIFLARSNKSMEEIKEYITTNYYAPTKPLDELRPIYKGDATCIGSVPEAFEAFYESTSFEDAIRNAISIGGDSDTIAAITGSIAEAYYGIPKRLVDEAKLYLDDYLKAIIKRFEQLYGDKIIYDEDE